MRPFLLLMLCLGASFSAFADQPAREVGSRAITWLDWSDSVFARARKEKKLVMLDLEAVWCHWCHVMDETTYKNPKVIAAMQEHVLAVRVDQDARPDLSLRYQDYGWPATILFDGNGKELALESGYIEADDLLKLIAELVKDPRPKKSHVESEPRPHFAAQAALSEALRKKLIQDWTDRYDDVHGGWNHGNKYLDWDSVEYALLHARAAKGETARRTDKMARQTLDAALKLIDPVWGGIYQYSVGGDWNEPHFEKIMSMQAENLRTYALAYGQYGEAKYLRAAKNIERFLHDFLLSPEGAYYTSQDADLHPGEHSDKYFALGDQARRAQGIPRIDRHQYARENGWAVRGLVALYAVTLDKQYLDRARKAADWTLKNRSLGDGGFRHDEKDSAGPYLGDTLAMGRASLALYQATGDRPWLEHAEKAARFIGKTFAAGPADSHPGFVTAVMPTGSALTARAEREENLAVARFGNLLSHYTGNRAYRQLAESALRYATAPEMVEDFPEAAVLLADGELAEPPLHITVVGPKDDDLAKGLFTAALHYPTPYKRLEWWDKREGRLPNPDVNYPQLPKPSAFVCSASRCSPPIMKVEELPSRIEKITKGI